MPRVLKYHTGVLDMTYMPAGPRTAKYRAVYDCSMKRACLPLFNPARRARGAMTSCMMNSRVKERTTV